MDISDKKTPHYNLALLKANTVMACAICKKIYQKKIIKSKTILFVCAFDVWLRVDVACGCAWMLRA